MADPHAHAGTPTPCADVVSQRVGDEMVLIHLVTNRIYQMNRTSARIWELLSAGQTLSTINATLLREFDVDEEALEDEIESFLSLLRSERLVQQ